MNSDPTKIEGVRVSHTCGILALGKLCPAQPQGHVLGD